MPGFDKTGPEGKGPMTGRRMGPCCRGAGFRRGRGFGWRCWDDVPASTLILTKDEQKKILEEEKNQLESELETVKQKMKEIE